MRKLLQSGRQGHFGAKRPSGGVASGGIRKDDSMILTGGTEVPDVPEFCVRNLRLLQVKKNASYSTHISHITSYHGVLCCSAFLTAKIWSTQPITKIGSMKPIRPSQQPISSSFRFIIRKGQALIRLKSSMARLYGKTLLGDFHLDLGIKINEAIPVTEFE